MMNTATERLEIRLQPEDKRLLARAAQLEGVKLSQFVLAPAVLRARQRVAEAERINVSAQAYDAVLQALADPPKPTKALLVAMRAYEGADIRWR